MRILLCFIMSCLVITSVPAQTPAVKKVINKFDAKYLRSETDFKSPADFWNTVMANDRRGKDIIEGFKKDDKTLKESLAALEYAVASRGGTDCGIHDFDSVVIRLVHDLGIENINKSNPVMVIDDDNINASMDAAGQMRIFKGCFDKLSYNELLAVCAHETAHFACSHVVSRFWKSAKKEKRNKMWADIGAGIAVGVFAATAGYGAYNGQDVSHFNNIIANADILFYGAYDYANDATMRYTYRYSRDEEHEADIIAYRFMEQLGYGGEHVLSMLKKLKETYGEIPAGKYNNHPSHIFRIQVISALMSGYQGK